MKSSLWIWHLALITAGAFSAPAPGQAQVGSKAAQAGAARSLELNEKGVAAAQVKDLKRAEEIFRQSLAFDPYNLTAVYNLAGMYLASKKEEAAKQLLADYVKRYPKDAGLFARLGDACFSLQQLKPAAESYEKALSLEPAYPSINRKLGTVYALLNRAADAERMLTRAAQEDPGDGQLLASLSSLQLGNGKIEAAISTAKRAIQLKPASEVYVTLGTAYEMKSDPQNALIAFRRAVDLGDRRPELRKKIEEIEKLGEGK